MELKAKLVSEPKADAPSSSLLARWLSPRWSDLPQSQRGGALFATDLSAFLSSPPILSLDILSVANKDFLSSELSSLQRHDQHPVRHLVGVHNAKVNSYFYVYSFGGWGMCVFVLYLKVRLSPQLFTLGLFHKSTSG